MCFKTQFAQEGAFNPENCRNGFFYFLPNNNNNNHEKQEDDDAREGKECTIDSFIASFWESNGKTKRFWKPMWKILKLAAKKSTVPSAFESKKYAGSNIFVEQSDCVDVAMRRRTFNKSIERMGPKIDHDISFRTKLIRHSKNNNPGYYARLSSNDKYQVASDELQKASFDSSFDENTSIKQIYRSYNIIAAFPENT